MVSLVSSPSSPSILQGTGDEAEIVMYKGKGGSGRHCYLPTTTSPCLRLLGDGVWVRDWIREGKKKDEKKIKGTTKPLMTNLDRTLQSTKWVKVGLPQNYSPAHTLASILPQAQGFRLMKLDPLSSA